MDYKIKFGVDWEWKKFANIREHHTAIKLKSGLVNIF